jgi:16S rRNA (adenine1518-N6/adenine1519-N6)-dimethyltransferase
MSKSNATTTEAIEAGHVARKRFGQNFLHDTTLIGRLVEAVAPQRGDRIVEIGPGQAAITAPLIARAGHVTAIEIDRDLAAALRHQFGEDKLSLLERDVLRVDFRALSQQLGGPIRIVGNLPYNISSPILFHLLEAADVIVDQHVMLQKEVVDRMVAECGSKIYGRLSVMLQARYRMVRCLKVPPGAFHPAPKVDSAVVRMVPIPVQDISVKDWVIFSAVVATAFSQRRKMLRNTLAGYGDVLNWEALEISPTQRAEEISVERFIALSNWIAGDGSPRRPAASS